MSDRPKSKIYGLPLGTNVAEAFASGFHDFCEGLSPVQIAKSEVFVNTARMQRSLREAFDRGPDSLVPRIKLLTDISSDPLFSGAETAPNALQLKLEISRLISSLLDAAPDIAPKSSLFPLTDSLFSLLDEMAEEGVSFEDLKSLDITDQSGHWSRALDFLKIVEPILDQGQIAGALQQQAVERQIEHWADNPPDHPFIVLGSTGSRKTTRILMKAVAALPHGAVLLPGFDWAMPADVWPELGKDGSSIQEDHPQFRFWNFLQEMDLGVVDVEQWSSCPAQHSPLNDLISLSLRPAPVTDAWLEEGPKLGELTVATETLSLIEAPSPRVEAEAIAIRMRYALQEQKTVALISPDRNLTRQVAAALDRWDLVPDDSAGVPLTLTPPGRLLCQVMDLFLPPMTAEKLVTLLKHPIVHTGDTDRGQHLLRTRELELSLRRAGKLIVEETTLSDFAERRRKSDHEIDVWLGWIKKAVFENTVSPNAPLEDYLRQHIALAENLSAGPDSSELGELWLEAEGRAVEQAITSLVEAAKSSGTVSLRDYTNLVRGYLANETVRNHDEGRPDLLILGTLESRVQSADLVILGGLNDGIWPPTPNPDPWLNRQMRKDVGLLSPDRRIGLSAHDYQQATSSKEVVISRSLRTADSDTVPSRWVNRLTNLLSGLPNNHGPEALDAMRKRGAIWVHAAETQLSVTEKPNPTHRPSPQPPSDHRPKQLSVTKIKTLIRDPYAIYAETLLRLRPLNQLSVRQEYQLRGVLFHKILQDFTEAGLTADAEDELLKIADKVLIEGCPWPHVRLQWESRLKSIIPAFLAQEATRQDHRIKSHTEVRGKLSSDLPDFTLVGIADRIDLTNDGLAAIYDYKTGSLPSKPQQRHFDKQLLLEAAMQERGAFEGIAATAVKEAKFLGIGSKVTTVDAPLDEVSADQVWADLLKLITNWNDQDRGYSARIAMFKKSDIGNHDHLSRFGEWSVSDDAKPEPVK